jgi:hypothetical protein
MRLIVVALVGGALTDGFLAIQAEDFPSAMGFAFLGAVITAVFTIMWVVTSYNVRAELGTRDRKDLPGSIVGAVIAFPAMLFTVAFVGGSIAADMHGKMNYAAGFLLLGGVCAAVVSLIWCIAEYAHVSRHT